MVQGEQLAVQGGGRPAHLVPRRLRQREHAAGEISRLRARDDEDYETWRENALQRRYNVPRVTRMLDVELVIT